MKYAWSSRAMFAIASLLIIRSTANVFAGRYYGSGVSTASSRVLWLR